MKKMNFSGCFVACDLKVGRYRQHVELMKRCAYEKVIYKLNMKLIFFSNHLTNQSQI